MDSTRLIFEKLAGLNSGNPGLLGHGDLISFRARARKWSMNCAVAGFDLH